MKDCRCLHPRLNLKMPDFINNSFGSMLSHLRTRARLTNRELAFRAQVPETLIAGLQRDKRRVGEMQARRIGTALRLEGEELAEFIYDAINQCSEKLLGESKGYPAELLNLLATKLRSSGIDPEVILRCSVLGDRIDLLLAGGGKATITTHLMHS